MFTVIKIGNITIAGKPVNYMLLRLKENSRKQEMKLTESFYFAEMRHLKSYHKEFGVASNNIHALGEMGPHPYGGNPTLCTDGFIRSIGLVRQNMAWSKGGVFMAVGSLGE